MVESNRTTSAHVRGGRRRRLLAIGAAGLAVALLAACSTGQNQPGSQQPGAASPVGTPKPGGTLKVAIGDALSSDSLDPGLVISYNSAIVAYAVYDPLMGVNQDSEPTPSLAASWESDPAAKQWTFHLRTGVKWHDGSPFTSQDVAYTFKRWVDPKSGSALFGSLSPYLDASGVTTPDAKTVVLKLKKPNSLLAAAIATNWASKVMKAGTTDFTKTAIGTGPFKLTSWNPGTSWTAVRNADYWGGAPYVDGLQVSNNPDQSSKLQGVLTGSTDVTDSVPISLWSSVQGNAGVSIQTVKNMIAWTFAFDQRNAPYNNPKVLEALKLATDRNAILAIALQGHGSVTDDVAVPRGSALHPVGVDSEYSPEKAKALLAEAGYPNGLDIELSTSDVTAGMLEVAQAWQQVVKPAGINVTLKQLPASVYWEKGWMATPAFQDPWIRFHPALTLQLFYQESGPYWDNRYEDPRLAGMLEKILGETDPEKQKQMTRDALVAMRDTYSYVIPVYTDFGWAQSNRVQGVRWDLTNMEDFRKAWIES